MTKNIKIERTENTFLIPARDLRAVWNAVSGEETRYYLRGVYVESTDSGAVLTATDGHVMLSANLDERAHVGESVLTQKSTHDGGFILSLDIADKALKAKTQGELWLYGDTESGIIQALDVVETPDSPDTFRRVGVVEFSRIDGTFPDYRRVFPSCAPGEAEAPVVVNLALLDSMRKAAALFAPTRAAGEPVRITAGQAGASMLIEFAHAPHMRGVVMPMRWRGV